MTENCINYFTCGYGRAEGSFYCASCSGIRKMVKEEANKKGITNYYIIQDLTKVAIEKEAQRRIEKLMAEREKEYKANPPKPQNPFRGIQMDETELERRKNG